MCKEVSIPADFDFDKWTGPAPLNTYCPERVTNNSSWFQYDYSIGFLAGWGAHPLDVLVWGAKEQVNGPYIIISNRLGNLRRTRRHFVKHLGRFIGWFAQLRTDFGFGKPS